MRTAFDALGPFVPVLPPKAPEAPDEFPRRRYRTVFISDLHLGTPGCQATALLDFLKAHPSDYLYLVGDIVDGWQLRRRWYWPQAHNDVVQKLLRSARKGCRVTYVPGNHDEFARQFVGHRFGGIDVVEEAVHIAADGKQLWVIHGDYFDGIVRCAKWLAYLGDNLYEFTLKLNRHLNHLRWRLGLPYWSLSACLKHKVKKALNYVTDFEAAVAPVSWGYALFRHFHRPSSGVMVPTPSVLRMLERRGFRNLRAWTHGVDTSLFEYQPLPQACHATGLLARPVALFVGRVSYEKNIEAFLKMDFPGSKVVCGVGPVEAQLMKRFPELRWLGLLERPELAKVYAAADLFVFPSHADTFGLVMVEAMATGTPVAAYPVDGPLEVLGRRDENGRSLGGAMHDDLQQACFAALAVPRHEARARALDFSWAHATELFVGHLVSARTGDGRTGLRALPSVTQLSSGPPTLL